MVEQDTIEPTTGVRFPSLVVTRGKEDRRNVLYRQTYEGCGFTDVQVSDSVTDAPRRP